MTPLGFLGKESLGSFGRLWVGKKDLLISWSGGMIFDSNVINEFKHQDLFWCYSSEVIQKKVTLQVKNESLD